MIQIYRPDNKNYEKNGDMTLLPEEAYVTAELNQAWELTLVHPIDQEGRWKYIEDEAVIKLPSFNGEQLFRIRDKVKSEQGIEVIAEPIFMDARDDCFLTDIRPTEKTGQQALDLMTAPNSKYTARSDITRKSTAYYQYKNLIEAINGDDDNSFINRWGGEVLFDNYEIVINNRVGGDYGVQLLYGKNIPKDGIEEEADFREVITRIYPKAFNGHSMSGKGYVDSPLINNYVTVKARTMSFEDVKLYEDAQEGDAENGITVCKTQTELDKALQQKCKEQFDSGIDKPAVTISVNMVLLQNTVEYKDYKNLEAVSLGDTIHCKHSKLGITTDARVIALTYDAVRKKVESVVIGDCSYDYFNNVSSTVNRSETAIRPDGTVIGQQIQGIINMALSQLKLQNTVAKRVNVLAILFEDLDPDSDLFGAMGIGTQGFAIANERTEDGRDWKWKTFGTANGFWADLIVAGTMLYDRCRGGTAELGGLNNTSGVLRILDAAAKEIGRWDKDGILVKSGEINGPMVVVGGSSDGILKILNSAGKEIGRWDKNGIKATEGEINGPEITLGGTNDGVLRILDASGKLIGTWSKTGISAKKGTINGPAITVGGSENGTLIILDSAGKEIGRWDKNGIKAEKGSINGPKITVGGSASGELVILDSSGKEIGRWDKNGIVITDGEIIANAIKGGTLSLGGKNNGNGLLQIYDSSGKSIGHISNTGVYFNEGQIVADLIKGGYLKLGGSSNTNGVLSILDAAGKEIGRWDKDGILVKSGGELRSKNYQAGKKGFLLDLDEGTIRAAEILFGSVNADTQSKCEFRFKDGKFEFLNQYGEPTATMQIFDYRPGETDPGAIPGYFYGRFRISVSADTGASIDMDASGSESDMDLNADVIGFNTNNGNQLVGINKKRINISEEAEEYVSGRASLSGRAEFSDGTYLEFAKGRLVGGNAKAGAF